MGGSLEFKADPVMLPAKVARNRFTSSLILGSQTPGASGVAASTSHNPEELQGGGWESEMVGITHS